MKQGKYIAVIFAFFISLSALNAQDMSLEELVDSVHNKLLSVKSYRANATFEVDIEFINMPDKTAIISYEAPDKYDIETDGFLMIPKVGMKPMANQLDLSKYRLVDMGTEVINGEGHVVANLMPLKRSGPIVLSTVWIHPKKLLIMRLETFTKKAGSYLIDLEYDGEVLPSKLTIAFEIEGMNIPMKYFGNAAEIDKEQFEGADTNRGVVVVRFTDYEIED